MPSCLPRLSTQPALQAPAPWGAGSRGPEVSVTQSSRQTAAGAVTRGWEESRQGCSRALATGRESLEIKGTKAQGPGRLPQPWLESKGRAAPAPRSAFTCGRPQPARQLLQSLAEQMELLARLSGHRTCHLGLQADQGPPLSADPAVHGSIEQSCAQSRGLQFGRCLSPSLGCTDTRLSNKKVRRICTRRTRLQLCKQQRELTLPGSSSSALPTGTGG